MTSVASFKKWFQHIKHQLIIYNYCSYCCLHLSDNDFENDEYPNMQCRRSISQDSGLSHFIDIPIADQIKSFFQGRHSWRTLNTDLTGGKKTGAIEDIYDGNVYQSLFQNGPLKDPHNLSLVEY